MAYHSEDLPGADEETMPEVQDGGGKPSMGFEAILRHKGSTHHRKVRYQTMASRVGPGKS